VAREPLFCSSGSEALSDLVDACELIQVSGGTRLVRVGQQLDSLYGVLYGGLRVLGRSTDGVVSTIREFYRGETLGIMALLVDRPSPVDLFAVRDSTLMRLPRARFLSLTQRHPGLLLAFAQLMGRRAFDVLETAVGAPRASPWGRGGNVALLPVSTDAPTHDTKDRLIACALAQRPMTHVTAARLDHALGTGAAAAEEGPNERVTAWLSDLELTSDVVLYECDPRLPRWTARCVRQSDRLVIVASAHDERRLDAIAKTVAEAQPAEFARQLDLVLVHSSATAVPARARAWSALDNLRAIHHVRAGNGSDVAHVVRRLFGRPIGVVLSGGGARGIAHVGVLAAIADAGIPIDYACGTSMGAIFAAGLALGWSAERIRQTVHDLFAVPFALYDLTLPISSLLAGRKLDRVLHRIMGDVEIEDLWLPFFCVSTDLAHAKLVIHDRGSLWRSVRASCSIPGIFPPLPMDGHVLVDGGLMDNLPLDLLVERCPGPIIAVDVFPYGDPTFERPSNRIARWLRALRSRVRGEPASPPLFDILMRSTLVGSKFRQQTAMTGAEQVVYLEPPVASFGILQWRAHRALFDAGYRYASAQLVRYRSLFP
jgi:predicted acylesterase/phospholipase RssA